MTTPATAAVFALKLVHPEDIRQLQWIAIPHALIYPDVTDADCASVYVPGNQYI